jgi:glycosyltransferase involved in cell wall biosynthesis
MHPLVSIICLCYNHARFIEEAVNSVIAQTYENIELIIVDDQSTDKSIEVIHKLIKKNPQLKFIENDKNIGMCRSFNKALKETKGEFIIDLAADDIMLPERITTQVEAFLNLKATYGVVYSDAYLINEKGEKTSTFYKRNELGGLMETVPTKKVFKELIHSYRICSPTIMVRKKVLEELGGYDENLSYEDYDFFVRSSREYRYFYIDKPLTLKREVAGSDSSSWYKKGSNNTHLPSTLLVCKKALWLCKNNEEKLALLHSIRYHFRQAYFLNVFELVKEYYELIGSINEHSVIDKIILNLARKKISLYAPYLFYLKIRKALY